MTELDMPTVEALQSEGWISPEEAAALRGELVAMERMRIVLDAFQQDAQTRLKDYDPRKVNEWIVRIKAAAQREEQEDEQQTYTSV